jgi:hypothetical protein
MLKVAENWREHYRALGVARETIDMLEGALLPASFYLTQPPEALSHWR